MHMATGSLEEVRGNRPDRVIVIAATARTGSTLLAEALRATGQLGHPDEHLNPREIDRRRAEWGVPTITVKGRLGQVKRRLQRDPYWRHTSRYRPASLRRYLDRVAGRYTGDTGVLSIKLMWQQYESVLLAQGLDATYWGAPVTWIRISRTDRVRQAVSVVRAHQTNQWLAATTTAMQAPVYDADAIERSLRSAGHGENCWDRYFAALGVSPLHLEYEHLDAHYEATISEVFTHLGVDAPVPPRQIERQGDTLNDEWVERFRRERPASG